MLEFTFVLEDGTTKTFNRWEFDKETVIYFGDKFPLITYNGPVIRFKSLEEVSKVKYLHISVYDNDIPF